MVMLVLRKMWWVLILASAAIVYMIWRNRFRLTMEEVGKESPLIKKIRDNLSRVDTDAEIKKLRVKIKSENTRHQLDVVSAMKDEQERKKRLAELLISLDKEL